MGFFDFLHENKRKLKKIADEKTVNKTVHDDKNRFTAHMAKIGTQAIVLGRTIEESKKESKRLQKMLTATERAWLATGGK